MKKIVSLFLSALLLFACASCTVAPKKALSPKTFLSTMEKKGFETEDISLDFDPQGETTALLARKDSLQLEFYVFSSEEECISLFNQNKEKIDASNSGAATSVSINNMARYTMRTDAFFFLSRIDATILYCETEPENETETRALAKELGY